MAGRSPRRSRGCELGTWHRGSESHVASRPSSPGKQTLGLSLLLSVGMCPGGGGPAFRAGGDTILHHGQASPARTPADKGLGAAARSGVTDVPLWKTPGPSGRGGRSSGSPLGTGLPGHHGHWILRPLQGPTNQPCWSKHRGMGARPPTGCGRGHSHAVLSPSTSEGLGTLCPAGCPTGCPAQMPPSLHRRHAWLEMDTAPSPWTSQLK